MSEPILESPMIEPLNNNLVIAGKANVIVITTAGYSSLHIFLPTRVEPNQDGECKSWFFLVLFCSTQFFTA